MATSRVQPPELRGPLLARRHIGVLWSGRSHLKSENHAASAGSHLGVGTHRSIGFRRRRSAMPGMSACRRNRGVRKINGDHFGGGFYRAYGLKRGYGCAYNGKGDGLVRRRLVCRRENIVGHRGNNCDSCAGSPWHMVQSTRAWRFVRMARMWKTSRAWRHGLRL